MKTKNETTSSLYKRLKNDSDTCRQDQAWKMNWLFIKESGCAEQWQHRTFLSWAALGLFDGPTISADLERRKDNV